MATGTLSWRRVEVDFRYGASFTSRLVTAIAGGLRVSAGQRKRCFRMVKVFHVGPGTDGVAGLASERLAIRPRPRHPVTELALVWICVAARARESLKPEWSGLGRLLRLRRRVTLRAHHCQMRSCERIPALLMLRDRVQRRTEPFHGVAFFATIVKRRPCKLARVRIGMAIGAVNKGNLVAGRGARRNMTFCAGHRSVTSHQWIGSCRMFFDPEA